MQGLDNMVVFLDDIIVTDKIRKDHIAKLNKGFKILLGAGLKITFEKLGSFQIKIWDIGFIIKTIII